MKTMKKLLYISIIAAGLVTGSCDDYLDVNDDPNAISIDQLTPSLMLPSVEMNLATAYGNYLRIVGGYYSQHYSQDFGTSNYLDYSQFEMSPTRSSGSVYSDLYQSVLNDIDAILEKSESAEEWGTYLAATTLRAFTYQILVDCYGETPYSDALNVGNNTPKYDDGEDVYNGIIAELDDALEKVSSGDVVCTNFLFQSGKADAWIQFANALKLKLYMRMANVEDVKNKVEPIIAENNFPTEDVAFKGIWKNESGQMSPFFAEEFSTGWGSTQINVIANLALVGTMQTENYVDPRLPAFFEANSEGNYTGGVSGVNFSTSVLKTDYWCRPVASYDMPVYLLTVSEVEFFLAEYYARYGSAGEAQEHYDAAIEASFATAGVSGAEEYIAKYPYDNDNFKKSIGVAKWVALSGVNNFEAWCEVRRLDYPAFGDKQGVDFYNELTDEYAPDLYEPGTLYTPIKYFEKLGANKVLERFPYAESSSTRNINAPEFPGYGVPVFWGK